MPLTQIFRLGRDAEVRAAGHSKVANLALAYDYGKKDDATGKKPTQWVDGALWGNRAESLAPYLKKGSTVLATLDEVHIKTFTTNDGNSSKAVLAGNIVAIDLLARPPQQPQAAPPPPPPRPAPVPQQPFNDDDLPF